MANDRDKPTTEPDELTDAELEAVSGAGYPVESINDTVKSLVPGGWLGKPPGQ